MVRRDCMAAGMDYVLAKPLDMAAFAAVLVASGERLDTRDSTQSQAQPSGNGRQLILRLWFSGACENPYRKILNLKTKDVL